MRVRVTVVDTTMHVKEDEKIFNAKEGPILGTCIGLVGQAEGVVAQAKLRKEVH